MSRDDFLELSNFPGICDRLKSSAKAKTWKELAAMLGMDYDYFKQLRYESKNPGKKNRQLPLKEIIYWASSHGADLDWLLTGEESGQTLQYSELKAPIDPDVEDLLDQAREVLESDSDYAEALEKNIVSFRKAVDLSRGSLLVYVPCDECEFVFPHPLAELGKGQVSVPCPRCKRPCDIPIDKLEEKLSAALDLIDDPDDIEDRIRKKR